MSKNRGSHLGEDELVLHFYGEGDTGPASAHLEACADCRAALSRLRCDLELADGLQVPERPAGYGDDVWARVQGRLATKPAAAAARPFEWREWLAGLFSGRTLAYAGGLAALLLVVFWLGYGAGGGGAEPISERVRERVLLIAVGDHLERSQRLLIELNHAEGNGEVDVSSQRALAERLAGQNRLYRQTASMQGDATVTALLDELERLLVEIANGPDQLARNELTQLQRRIERRGILFKIRVIGSDVRQKETAAPPQV